MLTANVIWDTAAIEIVEIQGCLAILAGVFTGIFALGFSMAILKLLKITKS